MEFEDERYYSGLHIQIKLMELNKSQAYLCKIFKKKPSQVSQAIHTNLYPTLRNKIITHIEKLEARNDRQST